MKMLNRRVAPLAALVAVAVAAIGAPGLDASALAASGPLFASAADPAVPTGAATGASESATFTSISCASAGDCVAGGSYRNSAGGQLAMLETETNGVWGAPRAIALPSGATTTAKKQSATITSVSCAAQGFCVAVGNYGGSGNGTLVATEASGAWATGTTLTSVSGESTDGGVLDSVSCTSVGNCTAVGTAAVSGGIIEPTLATETSGKWAKPSLLSLPSGDKETVQTVLSVSCPAVGDCVVAGTDYPSSGPELPLVIGESGGHWQQAVTLGPLTGALTDAGQTVSIGAIDCAAVGQCTAVGNDDTAAGASGFAIIDSGGSFTQVGLPYPAGSAGFLASTPALGLDAVACADSGDCATGGGYPVAGTAALPDGAPMTAVEDSGVWSSPLALAAPANSAPATTGLAALRAISCPAVGVCEGAGGYRTAAGQEIPMVVNSVPVLVISSTSLPAAQLNHPYSALVGSSGGSGAATWTVSSGALPIGLTLNPTTGVISGTPRFLQRTKFTVTVSDTGPPAQSASVTFGIRVSTAPPPPLRLTRVKLSPRHASATGRRVGTRCEAQTHANRHHERCRRSVLLSLRAHLGQTGKLRVTATRLLAGRRVRHGDAFRCEAPSRRDSRDQRCTRTARIRGADSVRLRAGTHTVHFAAAFRGHPLAPGTYRLRIVPRAGGRTGQPVTVIVTIGA